MKAETKSVLKLPAVLVIGFVIYCIAESMFLQAAFAPDEDVDTFAELKKQDVPMTRATKIANPADHICVFGDINAIKWTLPSGPPAYLFDPSGKLVDFTIDVGDSTKFQDHYAVHQGKATTMREVHAQFGVTP